MALSDVQIERFSRQIILPQIGGAGQQRLLDASVALGGRGPTLEIAALYLAGSGVGRIALHGPANRLAAAVIERHPEVRISAHAEAPGVHGRDDADASCDVLIGADLSLADLDRAAAARRPLIAGGTDGPRGWLVVGESGGVCASCAARSRALRDPRAAADDRAGLRPAPTRHTPATGLHLVSIAAGVIGALLATEALKLLLGLGGGHGPAWLQFDAQTSTVTEVPFTRAADCPVCGAG